MQPPDTYLVILFQSLMIMQDGQDTADGTPDDPRPQNLSRQQGDAYRDTLQRVIDHEAHTGSTQQIGDMIVGFAQTPADGMYVTNAEGELEWVEPNDANCHLMVAVMDADDRRFIPYCDVNATVIDADDNEYGPYDIPFNWHPDLYHYGRNITISTHGPYDLRIRVNPLMFHRHDRENGDRYNHPTEVVFQNAEFRTGTR